MAEKWLELVPCDRNRAVYIAFLLVLLPAETDLVSEEGRGKMNLGRPYSPSNSKVVLTLLVEVVAVYMGLPMVYVQAIGLQLFPMHLENGGS